MQKDAHISIIQLIKSGDISVQFEISNLRAHRDIDINIRTYLVKSDQFTEMQAQIMHLNTEIQATQNVEIKQHLDNKLQNLLEVEKDFIANTLYLAETLSKIEPRSERLALAIQLFEEGKIREVDAMLSEEDLLNDQFFLLAWVEYQEKKIQTLENDFDHILNQNSTLDWQ